MRKRVNLVLCESSGNTSSEGERGKLDASCMSVGKKPAVEVGPGLQYCGSGPQINPRPPASQAGAHQIVSTYLLGCTARHSAQIPQLTGRQSCSLSSS